MNIDNNPDELAQAVKNFCAEMPVKVTIAGKTTMEKGIPIRLAADMLGMPPRTLEAIAQGKGFRYPRLLYFAMGAIEDAEPEVTRK